MTCVRVDIIIVATLTVLMRSTPDAVIDATTRVSGGAATDAGVAATAGIAKRMARPARAAVVAFRPCPEWFDMMVRFR